MNLDTQFSFKICDLYLDFITFTVGVNSHTRVVPNMFKGFPITEPRICGFFFFNLHLN